MNGFQNIVFFGSEIMLTLLNTTTIQYKELIQNMSTSLFTFVKPFCYVYPYIEYNNVSLFYVHFKRHSYS